MLRAVCLFPLSAVLCPVSLCAAQAQSGIPPMVKTEGSVQYACGGIGSDESTAMRGAMKEYPLSLLFSQKSGEYLASVDVEITGKGGSDNTDARFKAQGPVCLLKLPAGQYTVKATAPEKESQSRNVTVGNEGKTLDFRY
ncbi:peptidase associated/transthyretin-like domain-containing protein [Diaphorobacter aerolatus]|uniref:Carboxypeptidase regulatory-like domain-containing protein n=1 Tax=Diaphorobacter aerolatus TaxID=1288495 RepID=A0A7H0GP76_9BURK|nr:carboxypeptidase regulatory-like domain-containing protein [Diaphorobacter aerolatus]QNP50092.1 carboxypeptidase regulatory-like domain-containing protein [Diaphorobacter aerolatus]